MAGRKREAGDAIVETREGAAQARVGFVSFVLCEFCAMDLVPIAKTSPKWRLSNSKIPKILETLKIGIIQDVRNFADLS